MSRRLLALFLVLAFATWAFAESNNLHQTLPTNNATFLSDLQNVLKIEDASRYAEQFTGMVTSGCVISTGAGLTKTPSTCTAYPGGYYITETGSITFNDATANQWVVADNTTTGNKGTFTRVSGTHYLLDTTSGGTKPSLCASCAWLAQVTTAGGAVTVSTDLRSFVPYAQRYLNSELPSAASPGRFAVVRDIGTNTATYDNGTAWSTILTASPITLNGFLLGNTTSAGSATAMTAMTNGQLPIGATGSPPTLTTLTPASGVVITNGAGSIIVSAPNAQTIANCSIAASVAANALTVALKDGTGADPTTTSPCMIAFRSSTVTTPTVNFRSVTAATSLVVASTKTVGMVSNTASRLYVGALDNAGTVELTIHNPLSISGTAASLITFNETDLQTTTGTPANAAGTLYSTTTRTSVPWRMLGYIEINEVTAGTWASAPTFLQEMGPGVHRTGDIVQTAFFSTGAVATGSTALANDDNVCVKTDGDLYMSQTITPTSALNRLVIQATAHLTNSAIALQGAILLQDTITNALACVLMYSADAGAILSVPVYWEMAAGQATPTTFKINGGSSGGGTMTFNGSSSARKKGGSIASYMRVMEIFQ